MAFTADFFFLRSVSYAYVYGYAQLGRILKLGPNKYLPLECLKLPRHELYVLSGPHFFTKRATGASFG